METVSEDKLKALKIKEVSGHFKVDWSYSKMQVLHSCPRKYYYVYYGGKKFSALQEPNKEMIQFLKTLSNSHLVIGEIVHHVIKTYFKKLKKGEIWDLQRLQSFGYRILKEAVAYSAELRDSIFNTYSYTPKSLMEVYYGEVDTTSIRNVIREKINHHLTVFYQSDNFRHLREGAMIGEALIESRARYNLAGVQVDGVIDLLFDTGSNWTIADWKTGDKEIEETSLQLLVYGLWVLEKKAIPLSKIQIEKAYLGDDLLERLEFSEIHLQRARARIIQDAEILNELDDFGADGVIEAFSACGHEKICCQCPFKKICTKN